MLKLRNLSLTSGVKDGFILWKTLTAVNNIKFRRKRYDGRKEWLHAAVSCLECVCVCVCVCVRVCLYSRCTQINQCSQWLSAYSLTEPPLSPLISPISLHSPQMHSSIIRGQITVILQGWKMTQPHTHTHTHTKTVQTAYHWSDIGKLDNCKNDRHFELDHLLQPELQFLKKCIFCVANK